MEKAVTGIILGGGEGRRMGMRKPGVLLNGKPLIGHAYDILSQMTDTLLLSNGNGQPEWEGTLPVGDIFPGCGPAGGIYSALSQSRSDLNVLLSCDMPFVTVELLQVLLDEAVRSDAAVTLPVDEKGFPQPLCAIYRKSFLPFLETALSEKKLKLVRIIEAASSRELPIVPGHPCYSPWLFRNINTPEELREAEQRFREQNIKGSAGHSPA